MLVSNRISFDMKFDSIVFTRCLLNLWRIFAISILFNAILTTAREAMQCGVLKEQNKIPTILSGQLVRNENDWPWVVSIRERGTGTHICGGALISRKMIVTAAHCMRKDDDGKEYKAKDIFVVLGAHKLTEESSTEDRVRVRKLYFHPNYSKPNVRLWAYDLMLIRLDRGSRRPRKHYPACLPPSQEAPSESETCIVVGWGKTEKSDYSDQLMQAEVPIVSKNRCNARRFWDEYVDASMICAGSVRPPVSSCQGDSGGPLVCLRGTRKVDQWTLFGVVSWGPISCGDKPGVYGNIAGSLEWIKDILKTVGDKTMQAMTRKAMRPPSQRTTTPPPSRYRPRQKSVTHRSFTLRASSRRSRKTKAPRRPRTRGRARIPNPPCDATVFERVNNLYLMGPAPYDNMLFNISAARDCIRECCERGARECQSVLYYPGTKQCRLRKVTRCRDQQTSRAIFTSNTVVYYGLRCKSG